MDELQPQDIDQLLQELQAEYGTEESPPVKVNELLQDLQSDSMDTRKAAAERLGKLDESSPDIVRALVVVKETDPVYVVRTAAEVALRASVHKEYLQQHLDLRKAKEIAQIRAWGRERQRASRRRSTGSIWGDLIELILDLL